jgi:hypothetical protein
MTKAKCRGQKSAVQQNPVSASSKGHMAEGHRLDLSLPSHSSFIPTTPLCHLRFSPTPLLHANPFHRRFWRAFFGGGINK